MWVVVIVGDGGGLSTPVSKVKDRKKLKWVRGGGVSYPLGHSSTYSSG